MVGYFILLSIIGIIIGLYLANTGFNGQGMSSTLTLIVGIFFVIKEILDIIIPKGF